MPTVSILIGVIILIFGVGYLVTNTTPEPVTNPPTSPSTTPTPDPEVTGAESTVTAGATSEATTNTAPGTYQDYDAELIAQSDADRIFLSFYATWCPSCRALEADIVANAAAIPPGVEIYKIDFDTATALKQQYGVTLQHSIIEIESDGTSVSPITHPNTLAALLAI